MADNTEGYFDWEAALREPRAACEQATPSHRAEEMAEELADYADPETVTPYDIYPGDKVYDMHGAALGNIAEAYPASDEFVIFMWAAHANVTIPASSVSPYMGGWMLNAVVDMDEPALTTEYDQPQPTLPTQATHRQSAFEVQVDGDHYKTLAIQPMEYSMANKLDACQHSVVKYITRFRSKGGVKDLHKAQHVIDMLIEIEEGLHAESIK